MIDLEMFAATKQQTFNDSVGTFGIITRHMHHRRPVNVAEWKCKVYFIDDRYPQAFYELNFLPYSR